MTLFPAIAQLISVQIVNCLIFGGLLALLAASLLWLGRRWDSGTRFAIWFSAMLTIAMLFLIGRPISRGATAHIGVAEISLPAHWALYIFVAWAAIAAAGLARVGRGLWRVRSLRKSCVPVEPLLLASLVPAGGLARKRCFAVCASEQLRVPAAIGFFRPVIILPAWTLRDLTPEELNAVVLHEAAHLERWDDWTNLAQKIIRALLFFHPAVWWIDNRLAIEREMSCDDIVVVRSQNAHKYAACLVSLAEKATQHRALALVQAAVSRVRHTSRRVSKILDGRRRTTGSIVMPAITALATFIVLGFVAVRQSPELVGFGNQPTKIARSAAADSTLEQLPTAHVIPASLHMHEAPAVSAGNVQRVKTERTVRERHSTDWTDRNNMREEARLRTPTNDGTRAVAVNAAMKSDAEPHYVYFVTQTEQYDSFGNVIVTTAVWRIPVSKVAPAQGGVLPHST